MKDKHNFEALCAKLLMAEHIDSSARSSKLKRKRDAIAAMKKKHSFQLKELVRKDYQEGIRLREKQSNRRAGMVAKQREQLRKLEAKRWA